MEVGIVFVVAVVDANSVNVVAKPVQDSPKSHRLEVLTVPQHEGLKMLQAQQRHNGIVHDTCFCSVHPTSHETNVQLQALQTGVA